VTVAVRATVWPGRALVGAALRAVAVAVPVIVAPAVTVTPASAPKCERCWHWRDDVGHDPEHLTICARCTSNLFGAGETRTVA
jgi:isoleucyl-tRNA synthetase